MQGTQYQDIIKAVESNGSVIVAGDGKLQVRNWHLLPPHLQDRIQENYHELLAVLSSRNFSTSIEDDLYDLDLWLKSGIVDQIDVPVLVTPGVAPIEPGKATEWIRLYVSEDPLYARLHTGQLAWAKKAAAALRPHVATMSHDVGILRTESRS